MSYAPFDSSFHNTVSSIGHPNPSYPLQQAGASKPGWMIVPQTKVALIGFVLLTVAMLIRVIQYPDMLMTFMPYIGLNIIMYMISVYVINCTVVGKCNLYAWIVSYIIAILGILTIIGLIMALASK